jgi:regulatory factor X, other
VYAFYADRCANERVSPLNPASFGKLVRVIFPGIQTRRLGVRGESKYHYVDLAIADDDQIERPGSEPTATQKGSRTGATRDSRQNSISQQNSYTYPRLTADTAAMPSHEQLADIPIQHSPVKVKSTPSSNNRIFAEPNQPWNSRSHPAASPTYEQKLRFPPMEGFPDETDTIELPNIYEYAPPRTDIDAANNLVACYRTHATSLIDCIRFCKEKQFFRLFTSFHGTLTVPTQKLFAHPDIAPWIRECDWLMYQKMIRSVSQLTLQAVPPVVLKFLDTISTNLYGHLCKTFNGFPLHVQEARLEPASLFANLLHRMIRANGTAHAAAALLVMDECREQMWQDWVNFVNPKRVMESELPGCGYDAVFTILTQGVRQLLLPLGSPSVFENDLNVNFVANGLSNETIIDRLASFIAGLPGQFPHVSPKTLLNCISQVMTAALREITVHNGISFGYWWVTKVFVDEHALWLASLGGFLDHHPGVKEVSESPFDQAMNGPLSNSNGEDVSQQSSRYSSIGAGLQQLDESMQVSLSESKLCSDLPLR